MYKNNFVYHFGPIFNLASFLGMQNVKHGVGESISCYKCLNNVKRYNYDSHVANCRGAEMLPGRETKPCKKKFIEFEAYSR